MTSVNRSGAFAAIPSWLANTQSFTNQALSASGNKIASVFMMPEAATLTHGGFRGATRTGTPPTYDISLQAVGADGNPDGTPLASQTFTPPADATWNSTWQWIAFGTTYAAARGQALALVIGYSSGTIDGSNNFSFTLATLGWITSRPGLPFPTVDTTGSYVKNTILMPVYGVKSASAVFGYPLLGQTTTAITSSGNRAARKFTLPSGAGTTFQILGLRVHATGPATANTWIFGLWDAAGAVIQAVTVDSDLVSSVGNSQRFYEVFFDDAPVTLNYGTAYYLGIERAGSNCSLFSLNAATANDNLAYPLGAASLLSTWNGAVWSDDATSIPLVEPIFADMTASGGGAFVHIIGG